MNRFVCLYFFIVHQYSDAFTVPSIITLRLSYGSSSSACSSDITFLTELRSSNSQDNERRKDQGDNKDEEDDDYINEDSLGDWRSFRATLIGSPSSSLNVSEYGLLSSEQDDMDANENPAFSSESTNTSQTSKSQLRRTSVSKENELLLKSQSDSLAEEYKSVWCHELVVPEVGGLVVRMPLEVEIYKNKDNLLGIGTELNLRLDDVNEDYTSYVMDSASSMDKMTQGNKDEISENNEQESITVLSAQTLFWYRKVQKLIKEKMATIASLADGNGTIDPRKLKSDDEILLNLFLNNQSTWQEVCLVIEKDDEKGTAKTVVLNRPMAFTISSESLAKLILFGSIYSNSSGGIIARESTPISQTNRYMKFLRAFEASCGVYVGGPNKMSEPATIIHGFRDLEGSTEISQGTGIYQGGIDAAIDGVLSGKYNPLDFRFFVGQHEYKSGELDMSIRSKKLQAVACARSLALKQCIQLPKPLWHEVLELCGGELNEISRIEYQKRTDLLF